MAEEIREQERERQEMINRIIQKKADREAEYSRSLEQLREQQERLLSLQ
jgi:hypothetical protein